MYGRAFIFPINENLTILVTRCDDVEKNKR